MKIEHNATAVSDTAWAALALDDQRPVYWLLLAKLLSSSGDVASAVLELGPFLWVALVLATAAARFTWTLAA